MALPFLPLLSAPLNHICKLLSYLTPLGHPHTRCALSIHFIDHFRAMPHQSQEPLRIGSDQIARVPRDFMLKHLGAEHRNLLDSAGQCEFELVARREFDCLVALKPCS